MHNLRVLLATLLLATPAGAFAGPDSPPPNAARGGVRVRPNDNRSATIFLEGLQRSDTLRALVDSLEERDVVYLRMDPMLRGKLAGRLTWMAATQYFRYVRISLNPELGGDLAIATLGHELQHAVEVATAPSIVDAETLTAFDKKNGLRVGYRDEGWDTLAARMTGDDVRRELSSARPGRVAESVQPFDPREWNVVYRRARGMLPPSACTRSITDSPSRRSA